MFQWIWQQPNWPQFTWQERKILPLLSEARRKQGYLLGLCRTLHEPLSQEAQAEILLEDALKTSAIEGEILDRDSVRSSVALKLGLPNAGLALPNRNIEGLLDILLDATHHHDSPLTIERLCHWQAALFSTGYSGMYSVQVGQLRGEAPMRVVSGAIGKERIHFEAPPRQGLEMEVKQFLDWFNQSHNTTDGLLRAAIAHLWFVTIHPFNDGNGRLARTITDMALAQDEHRTERFYSLSMQIMQQRNDYYNILENTQRNGLDITAWICWFLDCLQSALLRSELLLQTVIQKATFWRKHAQTTLNIRQQKVLNRLLDSGAEGFIGGMNTRKYASLTKVSRVTAYREIQDLVAKGCLMPIPDKKGRNMAYQLKLTAE